MAPLRRTCAALFLLLLTSACGNDPAPDAGGPVTLSLWAHSGTAQEQQALRTAVSAYEQAHDGVKVAVTLVPEGDYNDTLQAATAAGSLPDLLDVDGPLISAYAHQGALLALDDVLPEAVSTRMLPSLVAQGTWRSRLWAVGAFDSGLALYGDRRQLTAAGVRLPTGVDDAWTEAEFGQVLSALAARDKDRKVLDLKRDYGTGEWLTYGFAPLVASAGGTLVDPETGRSTLTAEPAVHALTALKNWAPFVDADADGKAFTSRRVALSWVGHWTYGDYAKAVSEDLVVLPLPDLGRGTKSGQGSWAWALGAGTTHRQQSAALLDWLTSDPVVVATTQVNGAVPGTRTALASSPLTGSGKPLALYADQLSRTCGTAPPTRTCVTVPRPATPGYPAVTAAFAAAVAEVLDGGDPGTALAKAGKAIDADVTANHGYR